MELEFDYSRIPYILFSGGQDSTFLLVNYIKQIIAYRKNTEIPICISTVTFISEQFGSPEKSKLEKEARKNIINILQDRYPLLEINHTDIDIANLTRYMHRGACRAQDALWMLSAYTAPNKSDVMIGYIKDDNYTHKLEFSENDVREIEVNAQRTSAAFNNITKALDKNVKLKFPLKDTTRLEIANFLEKERLLKFTVWCDNPTEDGNKCGYCPPCKSHQEPKQRFMN